MRNDLKAVEGVVEVETDVNEKKVILQVRAGIDAKALLDEVAIENNKLKDWEIFQNE